LDEHSGKLDTGSVIVIRSPVNPDHPGTYRPNLNCTWDITCRPGFKGAFFFSHVALDKPAVACGATAPDRIAITKTNEKLYYCGEEGTDSIVYTLRNRQTLQFVTNGNSSSIGFWGIFFEYNPNNEQNENDSEEKVENLDEPIMPPEEIEILRQLSRPGNPSYLCDSCLGRKYLGDDSMRCLCAKKPKPTCTQPTTQTEIEITA
jgi:hypothetical protein